MSTTTEITNMDARNLELLRQRREEERLAQEQLAQEQLAQERLIQERLEAQRREAELRASLQAEAVEARRLTRELGEAAGRLRLAPLSALRGKAALALPAQRIVATGIRAAALPVTRSVLRLLWKEQTILAESVRAEGGELSRVHEGLMARWRDGSQLNIKLERAGSASVTLTGPTAAARLDAVNRVYMGSVLAKHARAHGALLQTEPDGSLVLRPPQAELRDLERLAAPAPGAVAVQTAGFKDGKCKVLMSELRAETGFGDVRPSRDKFNWFTSRALARKRLKVG